MGLLPTLQLTATSITRLNTKLGQAVSWLTAVLAATTAVIVAARLLFQWGAIGLQELLTYTHATVIMLAGAYTFAEDGQVRVDIFYRRFNRVSKSWVNVLGGALFLLPFALFTVLISVDYVAASWAIGETSADTGGIPAVFLLKSLILCNGVLLALQALADIAGNLITLTTHDE